MLNTSLGFRKIGFVGLLIITSCLCILHSGLGASLALLITIYMLVQHLIRPNLLQISKMFGLLVSFSSYVLYFVLNDIWQGDEITIQYHVNNLIYVILAINVVLFGTGRSSATHFSLTISLGLLIIMLAYLFIKTICMTGALESGLAKSLFHNIQECSRVRFGSRNALMTGAMLATLTALCYVDTNWRNLRATIIVSCSIAAGIMLVVYGVQSRGATLSLIFSCFVGILWIYQKYGRNSAIRHVLISSLALILLSITPQFHEDINTANTRLQAISETKLMDRTSTDGSISTRLNMYTGGIIAFSERPILGYGYSNRYNPAVQYVNLPYDRYSHLHNAMINHLVAGGIFGLLAYFLLYFPFWQTLRNLSFFKSRFDFALSQFYGNFFVIGLTTSTVGHFAINTFFAVTLTAILCNRTRLTEPLQQNLIEVATTKPLVSTQNNSR